MPSIGQFSVGNDVVLTLVGGPSSSTLSFSLITGFESSQETTNLKVVGLDGVVRYDELPQGWKGTFDLTRSDSSADDYFAAAEATYYAGGGTYVAQITETVTEPDGGLSQYQYTGVALKMENAGSRTGDQEIKQRISFMASRRRKLF